MSRRREQPKIVQSVNGRRLDDFAVRESDKHTLWLWEGRIPLGKLTVLDGDPGMGKSFIALDLAARVTYEREMPDGTPGIYGGVVLLCAEDDIATTVMKRLEAADAALDNIYVLETVEGWNPNLGRIGEKDRWPVRLPSDLAALRAAIEHTMARLVVIDPLVAFLDPSAGSGREQDMYEALGPLARLAEDTGVAMLLVRHLTKSRSRDPLHWGAGSLGIAGRVRAGLLAARDPDDPEHGRLLVSIKNNVGPAMPTLRFRIVARDPHGDYFSKPRTDIVTDAAWVEWRGVCDTTAATLKDDSGATSTASARAEAEAFLSEALREGPRPANEVLAEARSLGISAATLRRARADMGVVVEREGFGTGGRWLWSLPPDTPPILCAGPIPSEADKAAMGWSDDVDDYEDDDEAVETEEPDDGDALNVVNLADVADEPSPDADTHAEGDEGTKTSDGTNQL